MGNTYQKIKVAQATPEEFAAVAYQAITKMESATLGQLQAKPG